MSWYFLRPSGSLQFGDGRAYAGAFYRGSMFPTPQSVLGAARGKAGVALGFDWDFKNISDRIARIVGTPDGPADLKVRSVLLAQRAVDDRVRVMLPRPLDGEVFPEHNNRERWRWHPLRPAQLAGVTVSPAPPLRAPIAPLLHRTPAGPGAIKPIPDLPGMLDHSAYMNYLLTATAEPALFTNAQDTLVDERIQVSLKADTLTAVDGGLFASGRLSFELSMNEHKELGLAVELEGENDVAMTGTWRLGGRGGHADATMMSTPDFDEMRVQALEAIGRAEGRVRWVLVTPALFTRGWLPDFVNDDGEGDLAGVRVRLCGAAVGRPVAYSGWDLAADTSSTRSRHTGKSRPTRLFVPAGSVYFFEVVERGAHTSLAAAARALAEANWLEASVTIDPSRCDDQMARRAAAIDAASGLARGVFGPWSWFNERTETK